MWNEWLAHTNFSFLTGASHPDEMLRQAVKNGYHGIAVTDLDGVYGLARCYRARQSLPDPQVIQLRYGAELHLARDHHQPLVMQDTVAMIALNQDGYQNLCRILTAAHRSSKQDSPMRKFKMLITITIMIRSMTKAKSMSYVEWA